MDGQVPAGELLGHPRTHHVHAEYLPRRAVWITTGDDLDHAFGLADDLRPAVELERVLADDDVDAGLLAGVLSRPCPRNLGMAVDRPRNTVVHHGHRVPAE